jgi:hypothetical protein
MITCHCDVCHTVLTFHQRGEGLHLVATIQKSEGGPQRYLTGPRWEADLCSVECATAWLQAKQRELIGR